MAHFNIIFIQPSHTSVIGTLLIAADFEEKCGDSAVVIEALSECFIFHLHVIEQRPHRRPPPRRAASSSSYSAAPPPYTASAAAATKRAPPPPPPLKPKPAPVKYVVALYDFAAQADGDLDFKVGDCIEVVDRTQSTDDWWTGRLDGRTGVFPGILYNRARM
ncbi:SH3 domain-containing protein [Russula brevipes]|nr:SH3 domain-containing protein [Russula brevipes]